MLSLQNIQLEVYPFIKEGVINIFPESNEASPVRRTVDKRKESKLFIQTVDVLFEGEGEEGTNPMKLSREFAEKFSEIFLEDTMASFLNMKEESQ